MYKFNKKLFILSLLVVVIGVCLYRFPSDDGLRHVGMAFADFKSWGEVYPFSSFELFRDYDPWFGYDLSLKVVAAGLKCLPISEPTLKFLLVKVFSFLFLSAFLYLVLLRSGIMEEIKDQDSFTLAYIILIVLLAQPFLRIMIIRPFAFGSFFLLYSVGRKGIIKGALSSAALMFFYPYLAWFYTIPAAFAHFVKGDKRFALGAILLTVLFLCLQSSSFWGFQIALFKSDLLRQAIDPKIGEFGATLNNITFYLYAVIFLVLFPLFSRDVKRLNYSNLLIIIYLLPSLKYIRYFIDLTLPLLFISFGRESLRILLKPYKKFISYWGETLRTGAQKLKFQWRRKTAPPASSGNDKPEPSRSSPANLKPYIAVFYIIILILFIHRNCEKYSSLKEFGSGLSVIPAGSLVLTDFSLQYKTLYARPDLRLIPSCEMGFPTKNIRKEYLEFMNEGDVLSLAWKIQAEFFLEHKVKYIKPEDGEFLRLVNKIDKLKVWKVLHKKGEYPE